VGNGTRIGAECLIYAGVTIREGCEIGDRVIIHPGAVIGADGFGFLPTANGRREKVPQVGRVRIEDDVEVGANTTVDRATVDETVIRRGAKLDNLVQIAHNVEVGPDTCLAAQVGISGSTRVGARNLVGGQVGLAGHLSTCDDVLLVAQSGVIRDIEEPGVYAGAPAMERGSRFRIEASLQRLPEMLRRLREVERRLAAVEAAEG
jgi:UDP-3-O-[3-hydroxymyristoyl] glucosamine N-acyltransferase